MKLLSFDDFLKEDEDDQIEKELEKEIELNRDTCVRCGELEKDCICQEEDFYSTINIARIPAGKKFLLKRKENR